VSKTQDRARAVIAYWAARNTPIRNSKGNPFSWGVKYTGVGKNLRFYLGNGTR